MAKQPIDIDLDSSVVRYLADQILNHGATLGNLKGISDNELEAVYSVAFGFYRSGKVEDAESLFRFLCLFAHLEQKYWIGLGATCQVAGKYEEALGAYGYACLLDVGDPRPALYAANCHVAMGNVVAARDALHAAIEFSGSSLGNAPYRERAEALLLLIQDGQNKGVVNHG